MEFPHVSGQLPTRTIPHCTGIGPHEWFYSVVVVQWGIVRNNPRDRGPGGQWLGFIFYPVGNCPGRTVFTVNNSVLHVGQLPTGGSSPPEKIKANLLSIRPTIPWTIPHQVQLH